MCTLTSTPVILFTCSKTKVKVLWAFFLQYMLMMMGTFAVLAWFGSLIDNLLLMYLIGQCILHNCQTSSDLL